MVKTKWQIIRIPNKYAELFETMNDDDAWKLIKSIFTNNWDDLLWINKVYFNLMSVDVDNIENKVNGWMAWWRPKWTKRKPMVNEIIKPMVNENNNQDKISIDKLSKDKINIEEIKEVIISTEITKTSFWNEEINIIIESLKTCNMWIIDDTIKKQRQYWKLIKWKLDDIKWFNWNYWEFITKIYDLSNEYQKQYFKSAEKFYYNIAWIVAWIKTQIETKKPQIWRC